MRRFIIFASVCIATALLPHALRSIVVLLALIAAPSLLFLLRPSRMLRKERRDIDILVALAFFLFSIPALALTSPALVSQPTNQSGIPVMVDSAALVVAQSGILPVDAHDIASEHLSITTRAVDITLIANNMTASYTVTAPGLSGALWRSTNTLALHRDIVLLMCLTIGALLIIMAATLARAPLLLAIAPVLYAAGYLPLLVPAVAITLAMLWYDSVTLDVIQLGSKPQTWLLALSGLLILRWTAVALTTRVDSLILVLSLGVSVALTGIAWHIWYRVWQLHTTHDRKHLPSWVWWQVGASFLAVGVWIALHWRGSANISLVSMSVVLVIAVLAALASRVDAARPMLMLVPMAAALLALGLFTQTAVVDAFIAAASNVVMLWHPVGVLALIAAAVLGLATLVALISGYLCFLYEIVRD